MPRGLGTFRKCPLQGHPRRAPRAHEVRQRADFALAPSKAAGTTLVIWVAPGEDRVAGKVRGCSHRHRNATPPKGGVHGEVDSTHRQYDLSVRTELPGQVRNEADNGGASLRYDQDRRTEPAVHVLPAEELDWRDSFDIAGPPSKSHAKQLKHAGLVLCLEGPGLDGAFGVPQTCRHREPGR